MYLDTIMEVEQIAGYTALPAQDVTGDDYVCPGSVRSCCCAAVPSLLQARADAAVVQDFIGLDVGGCRLNGTAAVRTCPVLQPGCRCLGSLQMHTLCHCCLQADPAHYLSCSAVLKHASMHCSLRCRQQLCPAHPALPDRAAPRRS